MNSSRTVFYALGANHALMMLQGGRDEFIADGKKADDTMYLEVWLQGGRDEFIADGMAVVCWFPRVLASFNEAAMNSSRTGTPVGRSL